MTAQTVAAEATETETETTFPAPAEVRQRREELGVSRSALAELTGLSLSRLWAAEQDGKVVSDEHRTLIRAALTHVAEHGLPAHLVKTANTKEKTPRAPAVTRAVLAERLAQVSGLLDEAVAAKTLKEVRALVEQARTAALGTPTPSEEPEFTPVDQTGTDDAEPVQG